MTNLIMTLLFSLMLLQVPNQWGNSVRVKNKGDVIIWKFSAPPEGADITLTFQAWKDFTVEGVEHDCEITPADCQLGESGVFDSPCGKWAVGDEEAKPTHETERKSCSISGDYIVTFTKKGIDGDSINVLVTNSTKVITLTPTDTPVSTFTLTPDVTVTPPVHTATPPKRTPPPTFPPPPTLKTPPHVLLPPSGQSATATSWPLEDLFTKDRVAPSGEMVTCLGPMGLVLFPISVLFLMAKKQRVKDEENN